MIRITEQPSAHRHLEKMSVEEITVRMNREDSTVAGAIARELPRINRLIEFIVSRISAGGRLFYLGAGSGGRLSVLDAIELPNTYGIKKGIVEVILAGGVENLTAALEEKEDDTREGWLQLQEKEVSEKDVVVGISASGTTPFVLAALTRCRQAGIATGCIVSNPDSPIAAQADFPVEVITGPELVTGSTRMKCGTAQKMIFDMISTTAMIRLGRVEDNRMVHVQLVNEKITDRAVRILMERAGLTDYAAARKMLLAHGSVKNTLDYLKKKKNSDEE